MMPQTAHQHSYKVEKIAQPNWYWAAAGVTVRNHYSLPETFSQCRLASILLNRRECCEDCDACNVTFSLERTLRAMGHFASKATGGLDCVDAGEITGRGDLVILQRAAASAGGPKRFYALFNSSMNPMSPTTYDTYIGDVQTGLVQTRPHRPHDVIAAEMRYITQLGR